LRKLLNLLRIVGFRENSLESEFSRVPSVLAQVCQWTARGTPESATVNYRGAASVCQSTSVKWLGAGMRRVDAWAVWTGIVIAGCLAAGAQTPAPAAIQQTPADRTQPISAQPVPAVTGGVLHGTVKSGSMPLPGVTVTAQNTLTGKRFSTTTDITGAWSLKIPQNGRYVIRTQFAGFAAGSQEAMLNAASHDQAVSFELILASRAEEQQARETAQEGQQVQAIRQLAASGAQNLSLVSALGSDTETQAGPAAAPGASGAAGAELPSIAANSDFGGDSVAISGQSGQVSPLAGVDMDRVRDAIETVRAQGGLPAGLSDAVGGLFGGGLGGGSGFGGGGFGGGGFGGGRGNFRGFNPGQPHGAIFWIGSNSALNAEPFSLRGQPQEQPASGTNRFGITFMSAPYLPHLTKPSGKDMVFLSLNGTRSSNPSDQYATVPTDAERAGNIPGLATPITPVAQAAALLKYFPEPNLPGDVQNYHLLTTAQSNTTQVGVRYMRSLGKNATLTGGGRGGFGGGGGRRNQNQGLRQSINFNYNWSHSASDHVNLFPELGGKGSSDGDSVQAGYTVGYHKVTSIFNANWNRSNSRTTNYFTSGPDIATGIGILGPGGAALNLSPLNYGLPNVQLSNLSGLNEQQPSFSVSQTISLSETLSWIHGKHNLRFGSDYRRVHRDFLGGSNATGTFYFTGAYTGSSLGDFLLGEPQETTIDSAVAKSYLRDNVMDVYAQDDWRAKPNLTLTYGLRYEFFAPYTEKYGHLALVDTNPSAGFTQAAEVEAGGSGPYSGRLPDSLVYPFRLGLAPRVGVALRLPKQTVVRAGFGMNYTVGQYASFASTMAHQPPFANEQTNEAATVCGAAAADCLSLGNGFPAPDATGNYALDPHYRLPYVEAWNLDVQKSLPWGVVLNAGYNGSRGSNLDVTTAPGRTPAGGTYSGALFNYEQAVGFSRFNAGTLRVNKRLTSGIALGANYQYSHSIDDAGSVGGTSTVVAQNWQDIAAEEGNSSFDVRNKVSGTYLYELPFGKDKHWVTSGTASHILEGFSVSGSYTVATGATLTPSYAAAIADVARGTAGSLRPDRVPGVSMTTGGGSLLKWFNTAAFAPPAGPYGTASRNSIIGPGTIQNSMALSKTMQLGDTRSMELRATANNVFNTVQYSGVDTNVVSPTFGQVTSVNAMGMRSFQFTGRFRF
jgi:hypothetical protein